MVHVCDPGGTPLEIHAGPALDHRPVATRAGTRFVAGDLGLGHVVLPEPAMGAAMRFYEDVLGFHHRDSMRLPGMAPDGGDAWTRFLGCNARHHSLALFEGPVPSGIVHLTVEVDDLDAVGRGLDRCRDLEVPISSSLGRHTNDHMVSFYVATPGGFDAGGIIGTTDIANKKTSSCFVLIQVKDGKFVRVHPTKAGTFDCTKSNYVTIKEDLLDS
jgi:3,4-dihydroxy-9,10-secoandrosta-1,3,5(10)-triene-9,17-dione 4,5-dioxygenase